MSFSEICRICLSVNVSLIILKKTGLRKLYKTLTNSLMDEDEEPITVCFMCHARLIRCRRLQQQAIESNAVLEQLLAGGSTAIPKSHKARDEIRFTPICHIDIRPVECDIENDCKDEIFSLDFVKVEEENFENENSKFQENGNHETETAEKQEDLKNDAFKDIHTDLEAHMPLIAFDSKRTEQSETVKLKKSAGIIKKIMMTWPIPKPHEARDDMQFTPICHIDIRPVECDIENDRNDDICSLDCIKVKEENSENGNSKFEENMNHETEYITKTKRCSESYEKKIKSNSTYSKINGVRRENLDFESPTIKSKTKVKKDSQPINKKVKHPAQIIKKKNLKPKNVNILTKKRSGTLTKYIFECDGCSKKFSTKDVLAKHISYSHKMQKNSDTTAVRTQIEQTPAPQLNKIFNCDICEFKTSQKCYLMAHLEAHVAKKVYCCNNGDYKSTNRIHFQYRMKVHTGEKPFSCNMCEYKCNKKSHLQRHIKIHTGEKPFSCNICEYKCITKSNLRTHMKIHTGEKPFSCSMCEYKCIKKFNLQSHMKIHTGEKPFSCNICEYKCIKKNNLQRHMKIHTGEKPFSCNICEYKCILNSTLRRHIKIHTSFV